MHLLQQRFRFQRSSEQAHQVHPRVEVHLLAVRQEVPHQTHTHVAHPHAHWRKSNLFLRQLVTNFDGQINKAMKAFEYQPENKKIFQQT